MKKLYLKTLIIAFVLNATPCLGVDLQKYYPSLPVDADGRIETLNNQGGMAPSATGSEKWLLADLKQEGSKNIKLLDIGPKFGRLAVELYEDNFKGKYTAIDSSQEQLVYMTKALQLFPQAQGNVELLAGEFPNDTKHLKSGSFNIVLITHQLHFYTPHDLDLALNEIWRLLAPGGKVYATVKTPYSQRYHSFIPTYMERKNNNQANPGYIDNVGAWVDPATITAERHQKLYGRHLLFMSKEDLQAAFAKHNFQVVRCEEMWLGYNSAVWQAPKEYANREDAVITAVKPK